MLDFVPGDPEHHHIDCAWAWTAHAFQGRTFDSVISAMEENHPNLTSLKMFYVEISRARDRAALVTDDREALRERLEAVAGERIAVLDAVEPERAKGHEKGLNADRGAGGEGDAPSSGEKERGPASEVEQVRSSKSVDHDLGL